MMLCMICDDQKSELETVQKLVAGYAEAHPDLLLSVRCFSSPFDMLDEIDRSGAPDIALLDICMPGVLGTEVAREIQRKSQDVTDIVFLTNSPDFAVEAFALHVDDYLTKPYTKKRLVDTLDRVMEKRRRRLYSPFNAGMKFIGLIYTPLPMWKPGITSWAQNVDYYQPALVAVTNYDDAPISYSSTSRYLTAYTDVDKNASAPASHQAPGYLGKPYAGVDETLDWKFDSMANNVRVGPVTVIDQVFGLNGNWATLCELKPVVISLADIIIYVGGAGYESVVTDLGGNVVNTVSDGLPEPGFIIELPLDVDQALKTAVGAPLDEPLDLSDYLSFAYFNAAGTTRTWSLERYDAKEGNSSMADGRYIYRIVPAKGQDPIRLAFTDEEGHRSNSDDFEIELEDLYQIYDMTIYAGALNADFFRAVITFPDKRIREMKVGVQSAKLTIRGVTLDEDPTTTIHTVAPTEPVDNFTAQVEPDTLFYINKSPLEVENYNAVKLLADEIVSEAQAPLHQNALEAFSSRITQEYQVEFRYLDLVDTSNGNVWVTASNPVDIYWPYPEGTDQNTEFFIVHYYGLDRNDDDALPDGDYTMLLHAADERTLANTPYGIHIRVNEFSPFALFWKNENGPVNPVDPGDNVDISSQPPKTGDAADLALWIVLALGSLIGMLLLLFKVHGRRGW